MNIGSVLMERKLLMIGNFVLTSGKTSPYYLDLRKLPSYPEFFKIVEEAMERVKDIDYDVILGVATGGVPLASFMACKLGKPMGYVRIEKKGHGTDRLIEAEVSDKKVLVVDDVATTGGSLERASLEVFRNGGRVVGALVIVDREEGAERKLREMGMEFRAVYRISEILRSILDKLSETDRAQILEYMRGNV
jgi:orotate phosphoribosyltransferase